MSVDGIPDGWVFVRFDYVNEGESFLGRHGEIFTHLSSRPTQVKRPIVRKVEKPKRYRPFSNPDEAESLLGHVLRLKVDHKNKYVFVGITSLGFQIGHGHWDLQEAFKTFERLDGTPFGIEVTE